MKRWSSHGNVVEFLQDGEEVFPAMLSAISQAKERIHVETYILRDDIVGWRFARALCERSRAGVAVHVLVDAVGSYDLGDPFVTYLKKAGVFVRFFNPLRLFGGAGWRTRDHRKVLTVDGQVGFVGGLNLGKEHVSPPLGEGWHDAAVRLCGPVVHDLDVVFHGDWARRRPKRRAHEKPQPESLAMGTCEVLSNRAFSRRFEIRRRYLRSIAHAKTSITIANAYFFPSQPVRRALRDAVRRGVRVRLLLPGQTDVPLLKLAQFGYYERFLHWGFEIYEWPGVMLHHKIAVFDDSELAIGSYNLDRRSLLYNLEISVWVSLSQAVAAAAGALERDISSAQRRISANWKRRGAWQRLAEAFAFLLREQF